jgi:6-pyruvoyltetrahydropterin/6-carboxytetrahydropterin synthase
MGMRSTTGYGLAMETFGIRIYKEYFNFAAAHFLIFEDGSREELHGHNYQVQMQVEGILDAEQDIFIDFLHIKPLVKAMCDTLDHRTLLPRFSPHLTVTTQGDSVEAVYLGKERWVIPRRDVVILPIPNTSAERLAQYLCNRTLEALREKYPSAAISKVEFSVEETRGQAALYRLHFPEAKPLSAFEFDQALAPC